MAFTVEQKNFGIIKVEGRTVKVYSSNSSYANIIVSEDVSDARWNGNEILLYMKNGKVRRYSSLSTYVSI